MQNILIGVIAGIVSGMGMGGGTILIFLLTIIKGLEQNTSQAINLIFFIPTSIVAIIINIYNKNINLKLGAFISLFGIIGAIIGSIISINLDVNILRKCFGIFLAFVTVNEIYSIYKSNKS